MLSSTRRYQKRESHSNENLDRMRQSYISTTRAKPSKRATGTNNMMSSRRSHRMSRSHEKKVVDEEAREQRQTDKVNTSIEKIIIKKLTNQQRQELVKEKRDKLLQEEQEKNEFRLVK